MGGLNLYTVINLKLKDDVYDGDDENDDGDDVMGWRGDGFEIRPITCFINQIYKLEVKYVKGDGVMGGDGLKSFSCR